jgi:hypothetical protein
MYALESIPLCTEPCFTTASSPPPYPRRSTSNAVNTAADVGYADVKKPGMAEPGTAELDERLSTECGGGGRSSVQGSTVSSVAPMTLSLSSEPEALLGDVLRPAVEGKRPVSTSRSPGRSNGGCPASPWKTRAWCRRRPARRIWRGTTGCGARFETSRARTAAPAASEGTSPLRSRRR